MNQMLISNVLIEIQSNTKLVEHPWTYAGININRIQCFAIIHWISVFPGALLCIHSAFTIFLLCIKNCPCSVESCQKKKCVPNSITFSWYLVFHCDFNYCTRAASQWMQYTAHECTIHFLYQNNSKKLLTENTPVLHEKVGIPCALQQEF